MVLFVEPFDEFIDVPLLDHLIVAHLAVQHLEVVGVPQDSLLAIPYETDTGGFELELFLAAYGDFVVFVQHNTEIPIPAGTGTVASL